MTNQKYEPRQARMITDLQGNQYVVGFPTPHPVSKIEITCDLPVLHCDMWRACVYAGETLIFEAPLHNLAGVGYPAPQTDRQSDHDRTKETDAQAREEKKGDQA